MSDCILCGGDSGGSEYAVCAECCEANAASERSLGKQCADSYMYCDCSAEYFGDKCPCCEKHAHNSSELEVLHELAQTRPELVSKVIIAVPELTFYSCDPAIDWLETEKRSGPRLIAYGFVALLSFAAGLACGWLLL